MSLTGSGATWPWLSQPPDLCGAHVHVVRVLLDSTLSSQDNVLSAEELMRASRFVHETDRQRFMAARIALRCVLALYAGLSPAALTFAYSRRGRPSLTSRTGVPLEFNVAHAGNLALLAVARRRVGVDVEWLGRQVQRPMDIARSFFSPREVTALAHLPYEARSRAFLHLWTRKEAVVKAVGAGLAGLGEVEVSVTPGEPPSLLQAPGGAVAWRLFDVEIEDEFVGAIAVESVVTALTMWAWRSSDSAVAATR